MTAHECMELTPGCHRCDLNRHEIGAVTVEETPPGSWINCPDCNGMGIDYANDPDECPSCEGSGNVA